MLMATKERIHRMNLSIAMHALTAMFRELAPLLRDMVDPEKDRQSRRFLLAIVREMF
jgi:hypothetical protein